MLTSFAKSLFHSLLTVVFIVLLSKSAGAASFVSGDTQEDATDPSFFLKKGQFSETTFYRYGATTADNYNYLGIKTGDFSQNEQNINQALAYGVTDRFMVTVNDTYNPTDITKVTSMSGTTTDRSSSGFTDPVITGKYRVVVQNPSFISWDIFTGYSPNIFSAEAPSPTQDGTVARGSQSEFFGMDINHNYRKLTLQGVAQATYNGTASTLNLSNNDYSSTDAHWSYLVGINTQRRFSDNFNINLNVDYTFNDSENGRNTLEHAYTSAANNSGDFEAALNYQAIQNLWVSLVYDYYLYSNTSQKYADYPTSDTSVKDKCQNQIGLKAQYIF